MPWLEPEQVGPFQLAPYLFALLVIVLPNVIMTGATFFSLAAWSRSLLFTYLGVVGFFVGFQIAGAMLRDVENLTLASYADPFGLAAMRIATRYWTVAEQNSAIPQLGGAAARQPPGVDRGGLRRAGALHLALPLRAQQRRPRPRFLPPQEQNPGRRDRAGGQHQGVQFVPRRPAFDAAHHLARSSCAPTRFEVGQVFRSAPFLVMLAFGALNVFSGARFANRLFGTSGLSGHPPDARDHRRGFPGAARGDPHLLRRRAGLPRTGRPAGRRDRRPAHPERGFRGLQARPPWCWSRCSALVVAAATTIALPAHPRLLEARARPLPEGPAARLLALPAGRLPGGFRAGDGQQQIRRLPADDPLHAERDHPRRPSTTSTTSTTSRDSPGIALFGHERLRPLPVRRLRLQPLLDLRRRPPDRPGDPLLGARPRHRLGLPPRARQKPLPRRRPDRDDRRRSGLPRHRRLGLLQHQRAQHLPLGRRPQGTAGRLRKEVPAVPRARPCRGWWRCKPTSTSSRTSGGWRPAA